MANTSQLTVVNGLPKFSGVPRAGESYFKPEISAKYFIEALENYYASNNVNTEAGKLNIFYNMIDHTRKNALTLIPCFKGANIQTFSEIKEQVLEFYDKDKQTEFQPAAKSFMKLSLHDDIEGNLTQLNTLTKNLAEAYVTGEHYLGPEFDEDTILANRTLVTGPPVSYSYNIGTREPMELVKVLQNLLMQIVIAANTHKKVAEKVKKVGPGTKSTKLMTYTNKIIYDHPLPNADKTIEKKEEVAWKASEAINNNTRTIQREPSQYTRTNKPLHNTKAQYRGDGRQKCFNCNEVGHTRRECRVCAFCKRTGHTARLCEARIKKAKGKFCTNCQLKDSHDTHECYSGGRRPTKTRHRDVRMLREYPYNDGPTYNNEWAPNDCEYSDDRQGEHPPQT